MTEVLIFSAALIAAVLLSGIADRTILSAAVLFLVVGFLAGDHATGLLHARPTDPLERTLAELALFSTLFTDGMRTSLPELSRTWRLPGRALIFGLPLTMIILAVLARATTGISWAEAALLGAVLSPTDPVFASAIVGREEVPEKLRRLLNVESGMNDGLALPVVLVMLAVISSQHTQVGHLVGEVLLGTVAGIAIPWIVIRLEATRFFSAVKVYEPINAFAIGLFLLALTSTVHINEFLAAFTGGITVATVSEQVKNSFHRFGEIISELLKLAAVMIFAALISPERFAALPLGAYLFMFLALFLARPLALAVSLIGTSLSWKEWVTVAWFGPKGFASVLYGLIVLSSGVPHAEELFHLAALVIVASIVLHSSTDVVVAKWVAEDEKAR